jgi:hypothetical protein
MGAHAGGQAGRPPREPWRTRPRVSAWDLSRLAVLPVIIAGVAIWSTVAYFAAAVFGFTDIAGKHNRWLSLLYGFAPLVVALPVSTYIVLWLKRPARPSEMPRLSKWFSWRV